MQPRDRLTAREIQVATLVWQDHTKQDIAVLLGTGEQVIKNCLPLLTRLKLALHVASHGGPTGTSRWARSPLQVAGDWQPAPESPIPRLCSGESAGGRSPSSRREALEFRQLPVGVTAPPFSRQPSSSLTAGGSTSTEIQKKETDFTSGTPVFVWLVPAHHHAVANYLCFHGVLPALPAEEKIAITASLMSSRSSNCSKSFGPVWPVFES